MTNELLSGVREFTQYDESTILNPIQTYYTERLSHWGGITYFNQRKQLAKQAIWLLNGETFKWRRELILGVMLQPIILYGNLHDFAVYAAQNATKFDITRTSPIRDTSIECVFYSLFGQSMIDMYTEMLKFNKRILTPPIFGRGNPQKVLEHQQKQILKVYSLKPNEVQQIMLPTFLLNVVSFLDLIQSFPSENVNPVLLKQARLQYEGLSKISPKYITRGQLPDYITNRQQLLDADDKKFPLFFPELYKQVLNNADKRLRALGG